MFTAIGIGRVHCLRYQDQQCKRLPLVIINGIRISRVHYRYQDQKQPCSLLLELSSAMFAIGIMIIHVHCYRYQDQRCSLLLRGYLYPVGPHRQCIGLAFRRSHVRGSLSAASLVICSRIALCNAWSSGGTALCRVGGATSQLDLPSLTPLSVVGCGRLQRGAPQWATSVAHFSSP